MAVSKQHIGVDGSVMMGAMMDVGGEEKGGR